METVILNQSAETVEYPTLSDRVQSTFIDTIVIVILVFLFASVPEMYEGAPDWIRIALFFGICGVYEPVCTSLGFTIGNYLKGIRVRSVANTGKRIIIFQALVRYALKILLGWIAFVTIHSNKHRRAIHDLAVSSVMVKKEHAL